MLPLIKQRVIQLVLIMFILSVFTFGLMKLAPGDPVLLILNADEMMVTDADQAELRKELGFDQPLYVQYGKWMVGLLQLDLGKSYMSGNPVWEEMMERLPITLELAGEHFLSWCLSLFRSVLQQDAFRENGRIMSAECLR